MPITWYWVSVKQHSRRLDAWIPRTSLHRLLASRTWLCLTCPSGYLDGAAIDKALVKICIYVTLNLWWWFVSWYFHRPPTKLWEGNVFTGVCLFTGRTVCFQWWPPGVTSRGWVCYQWRPSGVTIKDMSRGLGVVSTQGIPWDLASPPPGTDTKLVATKNVWFASGR